MTPRNMARIGGLAVLMASAAAPAFAGSFYLQEQSVRGAGRAFSGEAADRGVGSMWWNPASIARSGREVSVGMHAIRIDSEVKNAGSYVTYPDEWKAFVEVIPTSDRGDMMGAYKAIFDMTPATATERERQLQAALAWSVWEGTISNMIPDTADAGKFGEADFALCFAQIEAHFFANQLFLEPDYIVRNADKLVGVPTHIVHGRFDQVCPLPQASRLAATLTELGAPPATFVMTNAGHSAMESETAMALTAIMDGLPRI